MIDMQYIVFDCMETLIDIDNFNKSEDYASHAYHCSGVEIYWNGFSDFYRSYSVVKDAIVKELAENKEDDFLTRFRLLCKSNCNINESDVNKIANQLFENFWKKYSDSCYVRNDVKETLAFLGKTYKLGIVSNFKIEGGIEKLLEDNGIGHHFDFVITSISVGWRKPDRSIYESMLKETNSTPPEHLFVGDDYENDFKQPRRIGMRALLLDRENKYPHIEDRITNLSDLQNRLPLG